MPTLKRVAFWQLTLDGANDPQKRYRLLGGVLAFGEPTRRAKGHLNNSSLAGGVFCASDPTPKRLIKKNE